MTPKGLWRIVNTYGIGSRDLTKLRILGCTILCVYMLGQSVAALLLNEGGKRQQFQTWEDVLFHEYNCWLFLECLLLPRNIRTLLTILDSEHYDYKDNVTEEKRLVMKTGQENLNKVLTVFERTILFYHINLFFPPFFMAIFTLIRKTPEEKMPYNLFFPSECWYPFEIDSFIVYILIYSYQIVYLVVMYQNTVSYMGSAVAILHYITTDVKLLKVAVKELDHLIRFNKFIQTSNVDDLKVPDGCLHESIPSKEYEERLANYMRQLIEHHNLIYRNLKTINSVLTLSSLNINKTAIALCCISFVCFFEMEQTVDKIKYAASVCLVTAIIFVYSTNGQMLQDEGEELRMALYECTWWDLPVKYKRSLLLMMVRGKTEMEMRPMGLYTWNFDSFSSTVNAGYAYCNFLRHANKM